MYVFLTLTKSGNEQIFITQTIVFGRVVLVDVFEILIDIGSSLDTEKPETQDFCVCKQGQRVLRELN